MEIFAVTLKTHLQCLCIEKYWLREILFNVGILFILFYIPKESKIISLKNINLKHDVLPKTIIYGKYFVLVLKVSRLCYHCKINMCYEAASRKISGTYRSDS